jgi:hypothetical protein
VGGGAAHGERHNSETTRTRYTTAVAGLDERLVLAVTVALSGAATHVDRCGGGVVKTTGRLTTMISKNP